MVQQQQITEYHKVGVCDILTKQTSHCLRPLHDIYLAMLTITKCWNAT